MTRRPLRSLIALAITALTLFALPTAASAVAVPIRIIDVTPSSWDFGTMRLGTDQLYKTLTVTNSATSNSPWTYTGSSVTNSDGSISTFNQSGCTSQTLSPGQSCTVTVWLAPSTTGHKTGTFTPTIGDATSVGSVSLTGDVTDPQASYSSGTVLDWDYVDFNGGMVSKTETISNTGIGDLHVTDLGISGVDTDQWDYDNSDCGS